MDDRSELSFAGRVAIVTGAGHGLGRAYALELARRGASVVVNDIAVRVDGRTASRAVVDAIHGLGGTAVASEHSVADPEQAEAIVAAARSEFGRVDIVINNAGANHHTPFEQTDVALLQHHFALHVQGAYVITKAAYADMAPRGHGRIVFVSSATGMFGRPGGVAYGTAKAGLIGLMNAVSLEGEEHGILANAVLPIAETNISERSRGEEVAYDPELSGEPRQDPRFVVPLVCYLASDACTSTHGIYSSVLGRYARVYVAVAAGWHPERDVPPSLEELATHWADVNRPTGFTFPASTSDEVAGATSPPRYREEGS